MTEAVVASGRAAARKPAERFVARNSVFVGDSGYFDSSDRWFAVHFHLVGRSRRLHDLRFGHHKFVAGKYLELLPRLLSETDGH